MRRWLLAAPACALGLVLYDYPQAAPAQSAAASPPAGAAQLAHPARGFSPLTHCPELRVADEGELAVIVFLVGSTGVPTQASVRASSGSPELDAAAVKCVRALHFLPLARLGDGVAIDSWQQLGLRWAKSTGTHADTATPAAAPAAAGSAAMPAARRVAVRVCVDESGQLARDPTLTHSSGDPAADEAALRIARAGSGYYRPARTPDGTARAGCQQLAISDEKD
jgi:TonB family protein